MRLAKIKKILEEKKADAYIVLNYADIRYFSDVVSSNIALVITADKDYILSDARYKFVIERQNKFIPVVINKALLSAVSDIIKENQIKKVLMDDSHISLADFKRFETESECEFVFERNITRNLRIFKTPEETECIKKAQKIAEKAFSEVLNNIKEGMTSKEIAAELDYKMALYGSEEPAFETIVATGADTADCHAVPNGNKVKKGDFILFDFGATVNGYRSDMTRTVAFGEVSDEQKKIYDIVLSAHLEAMKNIKPGIKCSQIDKIARDIIKNNGYEKDFLHSLGHGVGIDIHEEPRLSEKSTDVLESGMVVTVEPGIYLGNKFGVRIEDTVVVTENGYESVADFPKNLIIL